MLETKRLYLRRVQLTDAPLLLRWGKSTYYHRTAGFETYSDLVAAKVGCQQYVARPNSYLICLRRNHRAIGLVELYERGMATAELRQTSELGFLLDQAFSGHGYMTEAIQRVLKFAFRQMRQTEVWAGTFTSNVKSQSFLTRLGFHYQYCVDYSQLSVQLAFQEKYYLLKRHDWLKL